MKMRNMSKKQQPNQRADNSRRPPMDIQRTEKIPHPKEKKTTRLEVTEMPTPHLK